MPQLEIAMTASKAKMLLKLAKLPTATSVSDGDLRDAERHYTLSTGEIIQLSEEASVRDKQLSAIRGKSMPSATGGRTKPKSVHKKSTRKNASLSTPQKNMPSMRARASTNLSKTETNESMPPQVTTEETVTSQSNTPGLKDVPEKPVTIKGLYHVQRSQTADSARRDLPHPECHEECAPALGQGRSEETPEIDDMPSLPVESASEQDASTPTSPSAYARVSADGSESLACTSANSVSERCHPATDSADLDETARPSTDEQQHRGLQKAGSSGPRPLRWGLRVCACVAGAAMAGLVARRQ
eukprot:jgi/Ulvmu1/11024/UM007_0204.1